MRKRDNLFISILAFLSILTSIRLFSRLFTGIDFGKELVSNEQLKGTDDSAKSTSKQRIAELTVKRGILLRRKCLISVCWLFLASIVGYFICLLKVNFEIKQFLILLQHTIYPLLSILFFAFGTLSRLGWEGQSNKGDTVYEQLDSRLLWVSYFLGIVFGILSFA